MTPKAANHPDCRAEFPVEGGPDSPCYELLAENLRSILPRAKALNVPGAADIDIDTLDSAFARRPR